MLLVNLVVAWVGVSLLVRHASPDGSVLRFQALLGILALQVILLYALALAIPCVAVSVIAFGLFHMTAFQIFGGRTALCWVLMSITVFCGTWLCALADFNAAELLYPGGSKAFFEVLIGQLNCLGNPAPVLPLETTDLANRWSVAMQSQIESQALSIPIAIGMIFSFIDRKLHMKIPSPGSRLPRCLRYRGQPLRKEISIDGEADADHGRKAATVKGHCLHEAVIEVEERESVAVSLPK